MPGIFAALFAQNRSNCVDVNVIAKTQYNDITNDNAVQIIFATAYSLIFSIGFIGNGGVIIAVGRNKRLQSARNFFLLNLMIADVLLCFVAIPITPFAIITKEWVFGPVLCRALPLSQSVSVIVTSWSLTAISLDKYVHILDPTRPPVSLKQAALLTVIIWVLASALNVPYVLSYRLVDGKFFVNQSDPNALPFCGHFCEEIDWTSDVHKRTYGTAIMIVQFVIPMVIITYCYSRILTIVRRDMICDNRQFSSSLTARQKIAAIKRKRRVNYILIGMVVAFVAAWLPLTLVNIQRDFGTLPLFVQLQPYLWALIVHSIAMTTVIWNPVLFFWLTRKGKAHKAAKSIIEGTATMFTTFYRSVGNNTPNFIAKRLSLTPKGSREDLVNGAHPMTDLREVLGGRCVIRKRSHSFSGSSGVTSPISEKQPLNGEVTVHSGDNTKDNSMYSMDSHAQSVYFV